MCMGDIAAVGKWGRKASYVALGLDSAAGGAVGAKKAPLRVFWRVMRSGFRARWGMYFSAVFYIVDRGQRQKSPRGASLRFVIDDIVKTILR